jgi:integrase
MIEQLTQALIEQELGKKNDKGQIIIPGRQARNHQHDTIRSVRTAVDTFMAWASANNQDLTSNGVNAFIGSQLNERGQTASIQQYATRLKTLFSVLQIKDYEMIAVPFAEMPEHNPQFLYEEDIDKLVDEAPKTGHAHGSQVWSPLIQIAYDLGLRWGEAANLLLENYFPDQQVYYVKREKRKHGPWQTVGLSSKSVDLLGDYLKIRPQAKYKQLFLTDSKGAQHVPLSNNQQTLFPGICTDLGIKDRATNSPEVSFHVLRHSCIIWRLVHDESITSVAFHVHHTNTDRTFKYANGKAFILAKQHLERLKAKAKP